MVRSPEAWCKLLRDQSSIEIANTILDDLIGYRSDSPHLRDDVANLTAAIIAIRRLPYKRNFNQEEKL